MSRQFAHSRASGNPAAFSIRKMLGPRLRGDERKSTERRSFPRKRESSGFLAQEDAGSPPSRGRAEITGAPLIPAQAERHFAHSRASGNPAAFSIRKMLGPRLRGDERKSPERR